MSDLTFEKWLRHTVRTHLIRRQKKINPAVAIGVAVFMMTFGDKKRGYRIYVSAETIAERFEMHPWFAVD